MCDQGVAQHGFGSRLSLLGPADNLDTPALAASTGVNLGLDHHGASSQIAGRSPGICRGGRCFTLRHRNSVLAQDLLCLKLVHLHDSRPSSKTAFTRRLTRFHSGNVLLYGEFLDDVSTDGKSGLSVPHSLLSASEPESHSSSAAEDLE